MQSSNEGSTFEMAASDVSSRSDGGLGNGGGGDDDPPEERPAKKRSAHARDGQDDEDDEEEEEEDDDDERAKKRPPMGLLKVSQALHGLGYVYEKDVNARHADTPSVRAGAVYWK